MTSKDTSRWIILHPIYMDSKSTIAEGRKIPVGKACERPTLLEVRDSVQHLKFDVEVEDKSYSRNFLLRGRLRVRLKQDDGSPVNPQIATRKALMYEVAKLVPKHHGRKNGKPAAEPQIKVPSMEDDDKPEQQAGSSGQSKKDKKKDKKKKGKK